MLGPGCARFDGVFVGGKVALADGVSLPDGIEVEVAIKPMAFTPDERAEFEAWDRLSDEAFQMIVDMEREDRDARRCGDDSTRGPKTEERP